MHEDAWIGREKFDSGHMTHAIMAGFGTLDSRQICGFACLYNPIFGIKLRGQLFGNPICIVGHNDDII